MQQPYGEVLPQMFAAKLIWKMQIWEKHLLGCYRYPELQLSSLSFVFAFAGDPCGL